MHRRRALAVLLGAFAPILAVAFSGGDVAAVPPAVSSEATIAVDGVEVDLYVELETCRARTITGPIEVDVSLPQGSAGSLVTADRGFRNQGYDIAFTTRSDTDQATEITIEVPAKTRCWLAVGYGYTNGAVGGGEMGPTRANQSITFRVYL